MHRHYHQRRRFKGVFSIKSTDSGFALTSNIVLICNQLFSVFVSSRLIMQVSFEKVKETLQNVFCSISFLTVCFCRNRCLSLIPKTLNKQRPPFPAVLILLPVAFSTPDCFYRILICSGMSGLNLVENL